MREFLQETSKNKGRQKRSAGSRIRRVAHGHVARLAQHFDRALIG